MSRPYLAVLSLLIVLSFVAPVHANSDDFGQWVIDFKEKAVEKGVSARVVEAALVGVSPDESVVALDGKQPEKKITWSRYLSNTISDRRVAMGKQMLKEHKVLLKKIGHQYGVQPKYIVALWAIESDFGNNKGGFSVVRSLATLAYEGRRAEFFTEELIAALKIVQAERMDAGDLVGSWAGAMGDCQFMPSTYAHYAVDGDGDGHRDIWNSSADVFASIANYLHALGWDDSQEWGHAVTVPDDFSKSDESLKNGKPASHWQKKGLRYVKADGQTKDISGDATLYAMYPGDEEDGVYLVTENFQATLKWNRSRYFATAVGKLADAIGE